MNNLEVSAGLWTRQYYLQCLSSSEMQIEASKEKSKELEVCLNAVASFPGPAQLFISCSRAREQGYWWLSYVNISGGQTHQLSKHGKPFTLIVGIYLSHATNGRESLPCLHCTHRCTVRRPHLLLSGSITVLSIALWKHLYVFLERRGW